MKGCSPVHLLLVLEEGCEYGCDARPLILGHHLAREMFQPKMGRGIF